MILGQPRVLGSGAWIAHLGCVFSFANKSQRAVWCRGDAGGASVLGLWSKRSSGWPEKGIRTALIVIIVLLSTYMIHFILSTVRIPSFMYLEIVTDSSVGKKYCTFIYINYLKLSG